MRYAYIYNYIETLSILHATWICHFQLIVNRIRESIILEMHDMYAIPFEDGHSGVNLFFLFSSIVCPMIWNSIGNISSAAAAAAFSAVDDDLLLSSSFSFPSIKQRYAQRKFGSPSPRARWSCMVLSSWCRVPVAVRQIHFSLMCCMYESRNKKMVCSTASNKKNCLDSVSIRSAYLLPSCILQSTSVSVDTVRNSFDYGKQSRNLGIYIGGSGFSVIRRMKRCALQAPRCAGIVTLRLTVS